MIVVNRVADHIAPANAALELIMESLREEMDQIDEFLHFGQFDLAAKRAEKIARVVKACGELAGR
jgi:hypothetical protein